ncbi:MAG: hypothetical protein UX37_C0030G0002 [Microgenomates group bacterium GW2011_GWA2_46_16]|nr:MAG: hypothetical protein UX37_C0030G0002 [Microgenomates group bacterium GW2011_GWA2_46_16]
MEVVKKRLALILCALPFIGIALWLLAGKNAGNLLTWGLILACPLSHMFLMGHGDKKEKHKH